MEASAVRSDVVAVVLAHNPGPGLAIVLDAIRAQSTRPAAVVVVDNASTDGTAALLGTRDDVEAVLLPNNLGVGAGHNHGWAAARRAVPAVTAIWSLEHDTVPSSPCLQRLLDSLDEHRTESPQVGAVLPGQVRQGQVVRRPRLRRHDRLTFNGALFPVDALDAVGGLREDFFIGHEDRELALRLLGAGRVILKDSRAVVEHRRLASDEFPSVLRTYYSQRNAVYLAVHVRRDSWARLLTVLRTVGGVAVVVAARQPRWRRARARVRASVDGLRSDLGQKHYSFLESNR